MLVSEPRPSVLSVGATVWIVRQCEAGTRRPLLDKPAVAPKTECHSLLA